MAAMSLALAATTSCSDNEPIAYENEPALYIDNDKNINFSFFYSTNTDGRDTVYAKIHAMGYPSDTPRSFTLYQMNAGEPNAAQAGLHYIGFDTEEMQKLMVMPAGKSEYELPIILLKDASLDNSVVNLKIGIRPNDNFVEGIKEKDSLVVSFSAQALKPTNWDDWYYAFGSSWGTVKMKFIIENTGITNFDNVPTDTDYKNYLNTKLKSKLFDYNQSHPDAPLAEADGTLVDFSAPYDPTKPW